MSPVRQAFLAQSRSCAGLGSPFMGRLMALCAQRLEPGSAVADRILSWQGEDLGPSGQSVPLRLAGALHGLVLDGADPALAAVYPPNASSDAMLWAEILRVFAEHETRLMAWLDLPPQTNEVRRSVALIPAALWLADRFGLPLRLSELGASGGLNLGFDGFALDAGGTEIGPEDSPVRLSPDWRGGSPPAARLSVVDRGGVDLNPLDPGQPQDALRLLAYLWPDQPERLALTRGAMRLALTRPDRGDAAAWLERRLETPWPGQIHMIYHTVAWQYFPPETQARARAAIEAAGAAARPDAPLAVVGMEADGEGHGAALSVECWPAPPGGAGPMALGRVDFHGRWIDWRV